jgi:hypothetical protein
MVDAHAGLVNVVLRCQYFMRSQKARTGWLVTSSCALVTVRALPLDDHERPGRRGPSAPADRPHAAFTAALKNGQRVGEFYSV